MLDVVQADIDAAELEELGLPRTTSECGNQAAAQSDIPDRSHWVMIEHDVDGLGVVEVDQERELLRLIELAGIHRLQTTQVGFQFRLTRTLERGIVDAIDTVIAGLDVGLEEAIPRLMIHGLTRDGRRTTKQIRWLQRMGSRRERQHEQPDQCG